MRMGKSIERMQNMKDTNRTAGVIGAVVGAAALIATLVAFSAGATASSPSLADPDVSTREDHESGNFDDHGDSEVSDEMIAAEACWLEVEADFGLDTVDESDDAAVAAVDWDGFGAAAAECEELLPADVQAELVVEDELWQAFDVCVEDAFAELDDRNEFSADGTFDDEFDFGPAVSIMDDERYRFAEFGEGDGTVTITKRGDDLAVEVSGDVEVAEEELLSEVGEEHFELDGEMEAAYDQVFADCEVHLPEGDDEELLKD